MFLSHTKPTMVTYFRTSPSVARKPPPLGVGRKRDSPDIYTFF